MRVAYSPDRALLQGKDRDAVLVIPLHARSVQSTPGEPNKCILLERTRYHRRVGPAQSETTKIVGIRVRQMGSRRSNPASTYWLMVSCLNLSSSLAKRHYLPLRAVERNGCGEMLCKLEGAQTYVIRPDLSWELDAHICQHLLGVASWKRS